MWLVYLILQEDAVPFLINLDIKIDTLILIHSSSIRQYNT